MLIRKQLFPIALLTTFLLIISSLPFAQAIDSENYRTVYKAIWNGMPIEGTAVRELQKTAKNEYLLTQTASHLVLDVTEESQFTIGDKIKPLSYEYHKTGIGKNKTMLLNFDWQNNIVKNIVKEKPWELPLTGETFDRLSYQLQLRDDIKHNRPLNYLVAEKGKLKKYKFAIIGEEKIETPLGIFDAVKIKKVRKPGKKRETTLWLAKDWDHVLIRLTQKERGNNLELLLKDGKIGNKTIKGITKVE